MPIRDYAAPNKPVFLALNHDWSPNWTIGCNDISSRRRMRAQDETDLDLGLVPTQRRETMPTDQLHPGYGHSSSPSSSSSPIPTPSLAAPSGPPPSTPPKSTSRPRRDRKPPLESKPESKLNPNRKQGAPPAQQSTSAPNPKPDPSAYQRIELFPPCPRCYRLEDRSRPSVSSF